MVGSMSVYEFLHMPYGLCNAPATFQHLMQNCLGELNLIYALIYLDDMIVYSKTEEEHLVRLHAMLERFMEHGLKLKPSKCNFFRTEISYLGHKVSAAGMEPGTEGLKGIAEIVPPATYTQVYKFLGAMGYFRCFIKGYTRIAKPLNDLLQGENSELKSQLLGLPPEDALAMFQELKMKRSHSTSFGICRFQEAFPVGDHMLSLLRERFWWPGMAQRMILSIHNCEKCHIFEAKPQIPPMEPILCTEPLDLVHIDYVSMEVTMGVKEKPVVKNVLVVKDHFTRYTQVYVTNNHTTRTTARVLYNKFFLVFGFPRQLMTD